MVFLVVFLVDFLFHILTVSGQEVFLRYIKSSKNVLPLKELDTEKRKSSTDQIKSVHRVIEITK